MTIPHTHRMTLWLDGEECEAAVHCTVDVLEDHECGWVGVPGQRRVEIESVELCPTPKVREFLEAEVKAALDRNGGNQEASEAAHAMLKKALMKRRAA